MTGEEVERGVVDVSVLMQLKDAGAPLNLVGFSQKDLQIQLTEEDVAARKVPVHVLVLDPKMLHIGIDKQHEDKILLYMNIADRLKDSEEVRSLSNHLAGVIKKGKEQEIATPFVVLENSSGTGKTQMAFNLQARGVCDVFYIVCGNPGDREQSVYDAYATRTTTFHTCISHDLEVLKRGASGDQAALGGVNQFVATRNLNCTASFWPRCVEVIISSETPSVQTL